MTQIPDFALGRRLSCGPASPQVEEFRGPQGLWTASSAPASDVTQRLARRPASFTTNNDFAETECDTRQTNLTRFPLLFTEKRTFFLRR